MEMQKISVGNHIILNANECDMNTGI